MEKNYQNLAEAVVRAVADYKGLKYSPPQGYTGNTYIVQKGDSLYSIARKFNTTVDELKNLNNLTSDILNIGQILRIPNENLTEDKTDIYVVKPGDSLYSIANKFNTTVDELKRLNNLTSNLLNVNQVLKIPSSSQNLPFEDTTTTYIVKAGDNLYSIARKFNTTVDELKRLNNLTSDILNIGQVLKVNGSEPSEANSDTVKYIVQKGDSLYSIAKRYNVTVDAIKSLNNLTSNTLSIGQELQIPTTSTTSTTYVVQSGDNLYSIARKFKTTVDELKRLNNLTSNTLSIGQILILE